MDYYNNRPSATHGRRLGFPPGMFQRKSQFGNPNYSCDMTKTKTNTGSTGAVYEPQPRPTINTSGGWVRPTPAGWQLPPDAPLGDGVAAGMGQTTAGGKTRPVSTGLFKGRNGVIDSREAVKKYGGQFIFK